MSWSAVRARLAHPLGSEQDPNLVAASWALGVAVSLSPFLGLHTLIALALAVVFRLNKVDVLLGTLLVNPWTLPPYWLVASRLGRWLTGWQVAMPREIPKPADLLAARFWQQQEAWLAPTLGNWFVGAGILAACGGVLSYITLRWWLLSRGSRRNAPA